MLSEKEINSIARLARIRLSEKEEAKMREELSSILDYIGQLNLVNTGNVEPLYQAAGLVNSAREDKYRADFKMDKKLNEKLVGQAPERQDNFVKVKSILRK